MLRNLYTSNPVARVLLDHFASRKYDSTFTKLDRAVQIVTDLGTPASQADLREVFKDLGKASYGEYVPGRRGHPSRFVWSASLRSVGMAASGDEVEIQEVEPEGPSDEPPPEMLEHTFRLRPMFPVTLSLPPDLTTTEAARLADFIRTLPFAQ
jgi:hypothetical protein